MRISSNKLKDILDEDWKEGKTVPQIEAQLRIFDKFIQLLKRIESTNPSIDDIHLRWVENKIEEIDGGIVMTKEELEFANKIWKKWK